MTNKQKIKAIKVPNNNKVVDIPQKFPRFPRLYLELLENKAKIKQDLINKDYSPSGKINYEPDDTPEVDNNFESRLDKILYNDSNSIKDSEASSVKSFKSDKSDKSDDKKDELLKDDSENKSKDKYKDDKEIEVEREYDNQSDKSSDSESIKSKLYDLLEDNKSTASSIDTRQNKYSRRRNYDIKSVSRPEEMPPSLKELEAQGNYKRKQELRDITHVSYNEQEEEDKKREIKFKFEILQKKYPNMAIPEFSVISDYSTMEKTYNDVVRRVSLDSSVESYKQLLMYGFIGCEFLLGNIFKLDMQGFAQQQMLSMNSYERLLIEIGEKSYMPTGSKWPVEVRLIGLILMNAAIFIISKMIMKKTGANLLGMINSINNTNQTTTQTATKVKRRMKGPDIDIDNLPDT